MIIVYLSLFSKESSKINVSGNSTGSFINTVPLNNTYRLYTIIYIDIFYQYVLYTWQDKNN